MAVGAAAATRRRPGSRTRAYLALDNLPKAKEHLSRLSRLCLFGCEQYSDLKKAVEAYEKRARAR